MHSRASTKRTLISTLLAASLVTPIGGEACTSLLYKDAGGAAYAGRTMELPTELP
jgi:choloylglycine hydrolase